ncbi:hypothetical protein XAC3218_960268 [Xanthomonas citri pv. citri]|nr:hypothetical protein XAC71A_950065 [Xanthomonas citri pv. citri]CEE89674.1 hypothetical protein XAC3218_960268 [Xanthomonas citri pv. citri]CEH57054.1 hypothetical protein XACJK48_8380005 [Xanthomonas citri pv. citri]CEH97147.1 hypothetical protein XACS581_2100035 [Xanthomonas citri pv. citri]CEL49061.1 hypothetical protein XACJM35_2230035 [Xanthomonas citri pv. citri]
MRWARRSPRSARPRPHPPCGHLLPQAGEGRDPAHVGEGRDLAQVGEGCDLAHVGERRDSVWLGHLGDGPIAGHLQCAAVGGWLSATSETDHPAVPDEPRLPSPARGRRCPQGG